MSLVEDESLLALLLWFVLVSVVPLTRYFTVVQGASTMLSWSMPTMFAPLRLKTPITRNATLLMRISLPIGDIFGNRFCLIVFPMTHTLLLLRTSRSLNISPAAIFFQSRTSRYEGVVP